MESQWFCSICGTTWSPELGFCQCDPPCYATWWCKPTEATYTNPSQGWMPPNWFLFDLDGEPIGSVDQYFVEELV